MTNPTSAPTDKDKSEMVHQLYALLMSITDAHHTAFVARGIEHGEASVLILSTLANVSAAQIVDRSRTDMMGISRREFIDQIKSMVDELARAKHAAELAVKRDPA